MGCGASSQPGSTAAEPLSPKNTPVAEAAQSVPAQASETKSALPPLASPKAKQPPSEPQTPASASSNAAVTRATGDIGSIKLTKEQAESFRAEEFIDAVPEPCDSLNLDSNSNEVADTTATVGSSDLPAEVGSFHLDEWQHFFKENRNCEELIDFFWERYEPEHHSLHWFRYKHDLDNTYQGNNVVHGLYSRLDEDGYRHKCFVMLYLYNAAISKTLKLGGFFLIPGQDIPERIRVAEGQIGNFEITKIDINEDGAKAIFNSLLIGKSPAAGLDPVIQKVYA